MWLKKFSTLFKEAMTLYNINEVEFAEEIGVSDSAIRQWKTGRNFPSKAALEEVYPKLEHEINAVTDRSLSKNLYDIILKTMNCSNTIDIKAKYNEIGTTLVDQLKICYSCGKNKHNDNAYESSGRIQAIVFDFDGTLTKGNTNKTTWESIWTEIGYDIDECRKLHRKFDLRQIDHDEWCKITEKYFKERKLHKDSLSKIASNIDLIDGCALTFEELASKNIKIYIVSGSILCIIQGVLKELCCYIDYISANDFKFSKDGYLQEIIGTNYDFEGKSDFICYIASKLKINTSDILFVGNSYNDKYAHNSGAKTLCINPKNTDPTDDIVWHNCIYDCKNLQSIMDYID